MKIQRRVNDAVHWFIGELQARVVAESGKPSDRFHLGKLILLGLKDDPDFVSQIDGATDESETNRSVLERTVKCATALKNFGLKTGDVIILMAPNHIHITIPFYAALCLGVAVAAVDRTLTVNELRSTFEINQPKIVFCQSEKAPNVQLALNNTDGVTEIITFDKGDYLFNFSDFLDKYADDISPEEFTPSDFDPEETIAFLVATSGTTGLPKSSASTHKNMAISIPYIWSGSTKFPAPTKISLIASPLQWLTAILNFVLAPILKYTKLQTSGDLTLEHAYHLINTYKPTFTVMSPTFITTLIKSENRDQCDFTCLERISLGGSAVPAELLEEIKAITPNTGVFNAFGMTELGGLGFHADSSAPNACGKPVGCMQYRLIDVETQEDIMDTNVPGELWVKGPNIFKEYYRNPTATEEAFAEDRWFKTGDLFYRDENWNFYFVERIKLMLKYKSYHISPVELENVIRQHKGVSDVAVTGIPDPECGDLAVACIVRREGSDVTAQEIKDLVKESLSDAKQLRGGVIFVDSIPMTASTKVHRRKLKEMALQIKPE